MTAEELICNEIGIVPNGFPYNSFAQLLSNEDDCLGKLNSILIKYKISYIILFSQNKMIVYHQDIVKAQVVLDELNNINIIINLVKFLNLLLCQLNSQK